MVANANTMRAFAREGRYGAALFVACGSNRRIRPSVGNFLLNVKNSLAYVM